MHLAGLPHTGHTSSRCSCSNGMQRLDMPALSFISSSQARSLQALYDEQIRPAIAQGLSAAVYTQLSDVEHELNGLVTYDRSIVKLPVKTLHKIFYIENE